MGSALQRQQRVVNDLVAYAEALAGCYAQHHDCDYQRESRHVCPTILEFSGGRSPSAAIPSWTASCGTTYLLRSVNRSVGRAGPAERKAAEDDRHSGRLD